MLLEASSAIGASAFEDVRGGLRSSVGPTVQIASVHRLRRPSYFWTVPPRLRSSVGPTVQIASVHRLRRPSYFWTVPPRLRSSVGPTVQIASVHRLRRPSYFWTVPTRLRPFGRPVVCHLVALFRSIPPSGPGSSQRLRAFLQTWSRSESGASRCRASRRQ